MNFSFSSQLIKKLAEKLTDDPPAKAPPPPPPNPEHRKDRPEDRRTAPRLKIRADVQFTILVPTETFSPYNYKGTVTDISAGGLCLRTGQIDRTNYLRLIREMRYAKLSVYLPNMQEPLHLRGRIAWWDFHDARGIDPAYCVIGISFHNFSEEAQKEFHNILFDLERYMKTNPLALGSDTAPR